MTIVNPEDNFNGSRWFLRDIGISLEARGLMAELISIEPNHEFSKNVLYMMSADSKDEVDRILNELIRNKYVFIDDKTDTYTVYEKPHIEPKELTR